MPHNDPWALGLLLPRAPSSDRRAHSAQRTTRYIRISPISGTTTPRLGLSHAQHDLSHGRTCPDPQPTPSDQHAPCRRLSLTKRRAYHKYTNPGLPPATYTRCRAPPSPARVPVHQRVPRAVVFWEGGWRSAAGGFPTPSLSLCTRPTCYHSTIPPFLHPSIPHGPWIPCALSGAEPRKEKTRPSLPKGPTPSPEYCSEPRARQLH